MTFAGANSTREARGVPGGCLTPSSPASLTESTIIQADEDAGHSRREVRLHT
jgi:hypothetical protein